jgi:hypothetical protein
MTEVNDLQAKYADKIAKLLAKAESTTPEEAEMLTAKAQELMAQYAIDEAMISMARGFRNVKDQIVHEEFVIVGIYRFPLADLCNYLFRFSDLEHVVLGGKNPRNIDGRIFKETIVYRATGFKTDIDRARMLFTSLQLQAITAESVWWREHKHEHEWKVKKGHYERRQFLFSFAWAAGERMMEAKKAGQKKAEREHTSNSVALAIVSKDALVQQAYEDRYPNLKEGRAKSFQGGSMSSHAAGDAAGRRADIGGTKVGGGSRKRVGSG